MTSSRRRARCRVLTESLRSEHPDAAIRELWCDARRVLPVPPGVIDPAALDLGPWRWKDLVLGLGERVAGWAILPWVVEELSADRVIVLDDTMLALGPLDPLVPSGHAGTVLRARRVDPVAGTVWSGALPGAVGVAGAAGADMRWWADRVPEVLAQPDPDQHSAPWWAPRSSALFLADDAFRLSTYLDEAVEVNDLAVPGPAGARISMRGQPVRLIDFAGFDPAEPWWFGRSQDEPVPLVGDARVLARLCASYADALLAAGWSPAEENEPSVLPGVRVDAALRRWFRTELAAVADQHPANPLVPGEVAAFLERLGGPGRADGSGVSCHADLVLDERPDVRAAFPHLRWRDRPGFQHWLWTSGLRERETSLLTLPPPSPPNTAVVSRAASSPRRPFGVNLVGYLGAELGLGVAARQLRAALESAGVPVATVSYDRTTSPQHPTVPGDASGPYHFNLIVIVPDQLQLFVDDVGDDFFDGHHNIGLWYWECDTLTQQQLAAFDLVDEVWAPTTYLKEVFAEADRVPVSLVPSPLVFDPPPAGSVDRARLGLDDRFTFLFSFDFLSVVARKNPLGLVDAYCRAFDEDDSTRLVLKSINGHQFPRERARVVDAIAGRRDVDLRDELLPASDRLALVAAADCYVSLHRSEGLGLTMAEAMAVATPVIATAYSGNLDFMDHTSAVLVPADVVPVGPGHHYPAEGHWADPDLDAAAAAMRRVRADAAVRERLIAGGAAALAPFDHRTVGRTACDALLAQWNAEASQSR